jgi:hypothetical protein
MTTGTLDTAARAFGSLIATPAGRAAVASLGLSGEGAPVFRCALYDTTVAEPATILVIDIERGRIAALTLHLDASGAHDYEVHPTSKLGFIVDCIEADRGDITTTLLGGIHGTVARIAA